MRRVRSRKGGFDLSLQYLMILVLSGIGLFILYDSFSDFLFSPSTSEIEKSNIESIYSFVDHFSMDSDYNSLSNCYTMLRMFNLENFQRNDDGTNSFFIIDKDGIYMLKIRDYEILKENGNYKSKAVYRKYFSDISSLDDLKLAVDVTENSDVGISIEVLFATLNGDDNALKIEELSEDSYIVIIPILNSEGYITSRVEDFLDSDVSQRKYEFFIFPQYLDANSCIQHSGPGPGPSNNCNNFDKDNYNPEGGYLVFDPSRKILFVSKSEYSNLYVKSNLCSFKYLNERDWEDYFERIDEDGNFVNINDIDYPNREIIFTYTNGDRVIYFKWNRFVSCVEGTRDVCSEFFRDSPTDITFDEFLGVVLDLKNGEGALTVDTRKLSQEDILGKGVEISFDDFFVEIELDYLTEQNSGIDPFERINNLDGYHVFDISEYFGLDNKVINRVETYYSNKIIYRDAKAYFYVKGDENKMYFYSVNENFLRRDALGNFWFNGEKIGKSGDERVECFEGDEVESIFFGDSKTFCLLRDLNMGNGEKFDIVLSPIQINKVEDFSR